MNSTSLGNVADILNVFGKQTIVNVQLSHVQPPKPTQNGTNGNVHLPTGRGELYDRLNALEYEEPSDADPGRELTTLDIDLSSLEEGITSSTTFRRRKNPHLFSQLSTARGEDAQKGFDEDKPDDEYRRRERPKTHK